MLFGLEGCMMDALWYYFALFGVLMHLRWIWRRMVPKVVDPAVNFETDEMRKFLKRRHEPNRSTRNAA